MSYQLTDRHNRQEDIKKGLEFIQSSLSFGTQKEYETFVQKLIRNLFNEGNDLYKEGFKNDSINQYSEALNLANYATSEEILITSEILERLHVNRAACYLAMGFQEEALRDCEDALYINDTNLRTLYCKSKALFILEKYKEAYEAVAKCSLIAPKDESVVKLTQELAMKLGLKIRKAYVRAQPGSQGTHMDTTEKATDCVADELEPDLPEVDDCESPLPSFSSLNINSELLREPSPIPVSSVSPSMLPVAVPEVGLFPSALASCETSSLFPVSNLPDEIIGDELDRILDSVPKSSSLLPLLNSDSSPRPNMPSLTVSGVRTGRGARKREVPSSIQTATIRKQVQSTSKVSCALENVNDSGYFFQTESSVDVSGPHTKASLSKSFVNGAPMSSASLLETVNPLEDTHEFRQACQLCFTKAGSKLQSYNYQPKLEHKCKKDIFIGQIKNSADESWKKIRPRPTKNQYAGQYYICKDVAQGMECTYSGNCTFAYCQEEIDVWTLERKGTFCRETLFGGSKKVNLTIPNLLQEYSGNFVFLCEKCFDHKPRMISQQSKENPFTCSHPVSKHSFKENKCLVHMFKDAIVKYCKIRPFNSQVVLDLCRHEVRYGCLREDECFYAHSLVELRVWVIQNETGITFDEVVLKSQQFWAHESSALKPQLLNVQNNPELPNLNIKFVCGQCWRNGQIIEADKNRKYCSAKARHSWVNDRQVVLAMSNERSGGRPSKKWISIRPCPTRKPLPVQFELCHHIVTGKKCQFIGNCAFAHSQEEKEIWTYMKDVGVQDMEKLYERLNSKKTDRGNEMSSQANKQIHLPTDYAETTVDFHCWLCGKNCNSERQWKMHISSEKHKDRVFHSEDDQHIWQHRFPNGVFSVCKRFLSGACPDGEKCRFAHGNAELQEWEERSKVLRQKLDKARKDQLISADDNDFREYSFLINAFN
ncbi:PREDICTED: zinc finger CCCH domain-containing protein 7A [Nanorana parkeri]|uniref:zinc finger CCCH domain-containing protein 7A n=1 Tax=Nanorana parkeri TaxID=125878 RepID=UPI000853F678|nr:PREDICTED: zinc finger CCCH domain-containing protein 7A [Nanorana parkeri]